jgi:hypothetical protein
MFKVAKFYLLDLERTIALNQPYFWKGNKHGYTNALENAGLFSREVAEKIVDHDQVDRTTVMISWFQMCRILGKDITPNEGSFKVVE